MKRTIHHCCANIQGMLNSHKRKGSLEGIFTDTETGRPVPDWLAEVVHTYDKTTVGVRKAK